MRTWAEGGAGQLFCKLKWDTSDAGWRSLTGLGAVATCARCCCLLVTRSVQRGGWAGLQGCQEATWQVDCFMHTKQAAQVLD